MTSLVTGATGFIGRFLVPALLRRGDTVHVLVPPDERGRYDTCARDWAGGARLPVRGWTFRPPTCRLTRRRRTPTPPPSRSPATATRSSNGRWR
ncbi:NAD-dependent epimerase/dehydratase family protein, partial [Nocardia farcinica]|uniref:NAD-dependent epimerase/dehydratase family protein n=1 Tax=Nocardia farcinica TaxID=37329 RepID=UPI002454DA2D